MLDKTEQFLEGLKDSKPELRCVFGVTLALIVSTSLGYLIPHITAAEGGPTGTTSFDSDGFSLDSTNTVNKATVNIHTINTY